MIDNKLIKYLLNIEIDDDLVFEQLGLSNSNLSNSLSFADDEKFLKEINENKNIEVVITTENLSEKISNEKKIILAQDPRWAFFTLHNFITKENKKIFNSQISKNANLHPTAFVAERNVIIGSGTIIGPKVCILEDVEIGDNCIIQAGTVIGSDGFEYKRTSKGILPVYHDGKVIIGDSVEIGANTCIDKGFSFRNTVIEDEVKIDNLVHVAHSVLIKKGAFVIASSMLAGSCSIGERAWVGPNATIGHVTLENDANVTFGSVVTKNVKQGQKVTGNFAIPHDQFIAKLKKG